MRTLSIVAALLLTAACGAKAPTDAAPAAPAPAAARDVAVTKHDPASGKPDTSAIAIQPGILLHLYEVVSSTQGRFHVVAGEDVRDVTLTQGSTMTLTFGNRTLNLTLKSISPQGANVRVESKGTF